MVIKLAKQNIPEKIEMRKAYCQTLIELASENENIVVLDADLMAAMGLTEFSDKFPERTVNCGVQEANMYGVAAGLSATGKIPYAHTFATFSTRRACDQIFLSCAYAKQNVRIIGSDPGVTAEINGGTHMPFEDMSIMRGIPHMTVIEPTDSSMLADIIRQVAHLYGMFYIRLLRKNATKIYEERSKFEIGKAFTVREGTDITIVATGLLVGESIKASEILKSIGISARVIDMFTIKPIDKAIIIKAAKETGAIVTAENHNIINGLGSAVAELVSENVPVPMERIGCYDEFGEVGPLKYLMGRFKMTAEDIVEKGKAVLERKA